ncbi:glutathione peroxidase [Bacillus coahuilensis m2-6]|uniref:Glutathione peroxidase n=1 Tax=Bacillus coahuilensis p1.1.43 TaxID=1150625 RepID=A0A147K3T8_9BACI|nr:glutathione peroxidase [Bacillus coahuilensis]KUP03912.1 glutathione peroxidase [Bacillus coahuilensis p1.1.43]KUP04099.1 glutathione peroxidase [Bacillus coahuilensis m2-6]
MTTVYDYSVKKSNGEEESLAKYQDKVTLVVNTASKCGFTPQFKELQELYDTYHEKGFTILGFPCNQFGEQDPGTNDEIVEFCQLNYGVSFPMYGKIDVKGDNQEPLFAHLTTEKKGLIGEGVKWNFTKFLVDQNGKVVKRYAPQTNPTKIAKDIEQLLGE